MNTFINRKEWLFATLPPMSENGLMGRFRMKDFLLLLQGVVGPIVYAWGAVCLLKGYRTRRDIQVVCEWLEANAQGEPAESPKSLLAISEGTCLPEERVRIACLKSPHIYQSFSQPGHYCICKEDSKRTYEDRRIIRVTR
jgi:hypothetical protein